MPFSAFFTSQAKVHCLLQVLKEGKVLGSSNVIALISFKNHKYYY